MKTILKNNQTARNLNQTALKQLIAKLAEFLKQADPDTSWHEVTVVLTDDTGITETNRDFFGKDHPTDVISFRYDPIPGEESGVTGDLIVNVECALREGSSHDGSDAELALYIAHGFDHLSGSEDDTPQKREAMLQTEKQWLVELQSDIKNLILG